MQRAIQRHCIHRIAKTWRLIACADAHNPVACRSTRRLHTARQVKDLITPRGSQSLDQALDLIFGTPTGHAQVMRRDDTEPSELLAHEARSAWAIFRSSRSTRSAIAP